MQDGGEMNAYGSLICRDLTLSPALYLAALSVVAALSIYVWRRHTLSRRLYIVEINIAGMGGLFLIVEFLCLARRSTFPGVALEFLYGLLFVYPYLTIAALIGLVHVLLRSEETRTLRHTICVGFVVFSVGIASAILAAR
jgi:hypothetical protein